MDQARPAATYLAVMSALLRRGRIFYRFFYRIDRNNDDSGGQDVTSNPRNRISSAAQNDTGEDGPTGTSSISQPEGCQAHIGVRGAGSDPRSLNRQSSVLIL